MPYDSKSIHRFGAHSLANYEFDIFTTPTQIPYREYVEPDVVYGAPVSTISIDGNMAQLDLPDVGDGNMIPIDPNVYTRIVEYPYLLRNIYTTAGDAYTGGPGFIYSLSEFNATPGARDATRSSERTQALALNDDNPDAVTSLDTHAGDTYDKIMVNAMSLGNYPTKIGQHLRLYYNFKVMNNNAAEGLGLTVDSEMQKIHSFYQTCCNVPTLVNTDCINDYVYDEDAGGEPYGASYRRRPISIFAPHGTAVRVDGELSPLGGPDQPFRHIVKSSTFIPTGLPPFDIYGFINIKNHDFSHLQSDGAAGMINKNIGYEEFAPHNNNNALGHDINVFCEEAFADFNRRKKYAPTYFWGQSIPSHKTKQAFKNYFMGNNSTFAYGYYDDPELASPDGSIYMNQADKSVHYRLDPSCVPHAAFRFHYDCQDPSNYWFSVLAKHEYNYLYHPNVYKSDEFTMGVIVDGDMFGSYNREGLREIFSYTSFPSYFMNYPWQFNLESATCGRIPPTFTLAAKYNSDEIMEATGRSNRNLKMRGYTYDLAHNSEPDGGIGNYTSLEKKLVGGNMFLKDKYPFPWDGKQRFGEYHFPSNPDLGTFGAGDPWDITKPPGYLDSLDHWITPYRQNREKYEEYGYFTMKWSWSPGSTFFGKDAFELAYNRYKNALRVYFGTRDGNVINSIVTLKKHVDKLAGAWTYDSDPKEARIRMQKRIPFKQSDFSAISEGYDKDIIEGSATVILSDDAAMTSDTEVLPDDMGGTTGVY
jgi:hypothetical protein